MNLKLVGPGMVAIACCLAPLGLAADETAETCVSCHKDALSLESSDPAELAGLIRDMRDGAIPHVVPVPPLSDDEIAALAEVLAATASEEQ